MVLRGTLVSYQDGESYPEVFPTAGDVAVVAAVALIVKCYYYTYLHPVGS